MKKIIILLVLVLTFGFIGCDNGSGDGDDDVYPSWSDDLMNGATKDTTYPFISITFRIDTANGYEELNFKRVDSSPNTMTYFFRYWDNTGYILKNQMYNLVSVNGKEIKVELLQIVEGKYVGLGDFYTFKYSRTGDTLTISNSSWTVWNGEWVKQ